ncbi:H+/oligopeptide symporter [Handroanthus impetiginosus]|uniref:H+/oligopeptide symporter n=1 Tax=Handroanthus impetiginosus TaxID=429701 RepID=A0A2G9HAR4_9LAMI|nr:H+/oligopeptide symporter [Handroanthus impetiginosus]
MITENDIPAARAPLLDEVVQGSVDYNGLPARRSKSGCWKSASFIIVVQMAEIFAYWGISSNLISYLTGPLGQPTAAAAANVNGWNATAMLLPLLGAFIADSFLGRYRTIIIASLLYILGLGLLSLSALLHSHNYSSCKNNTYNSTFAPPLLEVTVFFFSLYLVAVAQGGHKPCVQAFGADQFDEEDEHESKAKSSFFNWLCFSVNRGTLAALLVLNYIQENMSWELGFGIPCIVMCFALIVFLIGSMTYRFHVNSDERNPFVRISHVFVEAARNWRVASPVVGSIEEEAQQVLPHENANFNSIHIVEKRRLSTAIQYGLVDLPEATVPMSIWWLAPQYLLFGIADVFTIVGLQEFFYDQIVGELKSIGAALYFSIFGIGSFLSSLLISIIEKVTSGNGHDSWFSNNLNRAHLDYFYWLLAGLSVVSMGIYVYFAKSYIYYKNDKI